MKNDFIRQIKEMREAQKLYAKTKDWQILQVARTLEMKVDKMIESYG